MCRPKQTSDHENIQECHQKSDKGVTWYKDNYFMCRYSHAALLILSQLRYITGNMELVNEIATLPSVEKKFKRLYLI